MAITARFLFEPHHSTKNHRKTPNATPHATPNASHRIPGSPLRSNIHQSPGHLKGDKPNLKKASVEFPSRDIPMMDDDDIKDEVVPQPQDVPQQHSSNSVISPQSDAHHSVADGWSTTTPLLQHDVVDDDAVTGSPVSSSSRRRRQSDRDSSPFLMPVHDLSALPLGTNYGWRVED